MNTIKKEITYKNQTFNIEVNDNLTFYELIYILSKLFKIDIQFLYYDMRSCNIVDYFKKDYIIYFESDEFDCNNVKKNTTDKIYDFTKIDIDVEIVEFNNIKYHITNKKETENFIISLLSFDFDDETITKSSIYKDGNLVQICGLPLNYEKINSLENLILFLGA